MESIVQFMIPLKPVTKKNSQQICINKNTGKRYIRPSKDYEQYACEAMLFMPELGIDYPVNVQAVYYMPTRRRVDLINLHSALHDAMVDAGTVVDDNCRIIVSTDGSRVDYDKENPRTEVTITRLEAE